MKTLLRAMSLAIVVTGVCAATPAFADGTPVATTMTVTTNKPTIYSGQATAFKARVAPAKIGKTFITGTITWTITGRDGSTVACTSVTPISTGGQSVCTVGAANLLAAGSAYTVSASYSGDANFAPASSSIPYTVTQATTRLRYSIPDRPTSGASTSVVVSVIAGPGTPALTGDVTFAVASGMGTKGVKPYCAGPNPVPAANNSVPLVDGTATCVLPAGWMVVPPASTANKHPKTSWTISMSYGETVSFAGFTATKTGWSNH